MLRWYSGKNWSSEGSEPPSKSEQKMLHPPEPVLPVDVLLVTSLPPVPVVAPLVLVTLPVVVLPVVTPLLVTPLLVTLPLVTPEEVLPGPAGPPPAPPAPPPPSFPELEVPPHAAAADASVSAAKKAKERAEKDILEISSTKGAEWPKRCLRLYQ
ncbi:hypothetical protein BE21_11155 [Sorangium cellulosum]|uniref:Uncharacterized protein n=1 Tax=Sorangium cellulosum TaxID=56 RepID=A0A150U130_SORCE|nr:hypothetical protein BE21_11155 [Sorangium cellulosum]